MPITTSSKLELISDAVVLVGEKPITSEQDPRWAATVGLSLFDQIYENELQSNRWRFACTKGTLSLLNAIPANEWRYAFQLPPDMLLPIGIWPQSDFELYGDHLYTNAKSNSGPADGSGGAAVLTFEYMFKPDISKCPAYFLMLMRYALARDMVKPITESDSAVNVFTQKYTAQRARAMYADAQGRPNRPLQSNPFVQVR